MDILGLDCVRFGVSDMTETKRFFEDFGLTQKTTKGASVEFETDEGTGVELLPMDDLSLPFGVAEGSTVREMIWGVRDDAALKAIESQLATFGQVRRDRHNVVHAVDEAGYGIGFRVSVRRPLLGVRQPVNLPGQNARVDERISFSDDVPVRHMGYIVLFVKELQKSVKFYTDVLGFKTSDVFRDRGHFLRARGSSDHHNILLLDVCGKVGLHHLSFVDSFHDVVVAGEKMRKRGWKSTIGPGRHSIGSNFFWYFDAPCGGSIEFYSDMDRATEEWPARVWDWHPKIGSAWIADITYNA